MNQHLRFFLISLAILVCFKTFSQKLEPGILYKGDKQYYVKSIIHGASANNSQFARVILNEDTVFYTPEDIHSYELLKGIKFVAKTISALKNHSG